MTLGDPLFPCISILNSFLALSPVGDIIIFDINIIASCCRCGRFLSKARITKSSSISIDDVLFVSTWSSVA